MVVIVVAALAGAAVGIIATRRRYEEGRGGALGRYEGGLHAMAWRGGIIATRSCGNRSE